MAGRCVEDREDVGEVMKERSGDEVMCDATIVKSVTCRMDEARHARGR